MRTWLALIVLILLTALRVWYVLGTDVSTENAYYHLCAQHPAAAYYDVPAGTPLSVAFVDKFFGVSNAKHWLLLAPMWALLASLAAWWFARQVAKPPAAAVVVVALNVLPPFNVAALQVGTDLPALTFLFVGFGMAWRALQLQRSKNINWYVAALCFVVASLFSYAAALMALVTIPFLYSKSRRGAGDLGGIRAQGLLTLAVGAALVPSLWWHARNGWLAVQDWNFATLTRFDAAAINYLEMPLVLLLLFALAVGYIFVLRKTPPMLVLIALPSLGLALFFTYRGWSVPVAVLLSVTILLIANAPLWRFTSQKAKVVAILVLLGFSAYSLFWVWEIDEETRLSSETMQQVRAINKRLAGGLSEPLFLIGGDDRLAAKLAYDLRNDFTATSGYPLAFRREGQGIVDQFSFWRSYADFIETAEAPDPFNTEVMGVNPFIGRSAIYVGREAPEDLPATISEAFSKVEEVGRVMLGRNRQLYIYLCLEYQSLPL